MFAGRLEVAAGKTTGLPFRFSFLHDWDGFCLFHPIMFGEAFTDVAGVHITTGPFTPMWLSELVSGPPMSPWWQ